MTTLKAITLTLIFIGLFAVTISHHASIPPRDHCNKTKSILEICDETEGCSLSANELYRLTDYRDTMNELCPNGRWED